ncbi:ferritin [Herbivorax sp. ANBcel31]|uniref:ferritin n=1 Tax=Herbivorax sp. ANBcel31 TaxID=3069754 RepID=UPI0027B162EB|nr:ferritin [Herbivorax sp. ANBcel31]MDQ2087140.1 ferritin [Herbivorax sp. ANBcel31]
MISDNMVKLLNDQIQKEFYSSYLYLSMTAYFKSINLDGFANFYFIQAQEEKDHALKIFDYVNQVGGKVSLSKIDSPKVDFESIEEVLKLTLEHEQFVTKSIHNIVDVALSEKDHSTYSFLQWFVNEQVEEEDTADGNLKKFKIVGNDGKGILMIDAEMAKRVYTPLAENTGQ